MRPLISIALILGIVGFAPAGAQYTGPRKSGGSAETAVLQQSAWPQLQERFSEIDKTAKKMGYTMNVAPDGFGCNVVLSKEGKSQETHGILGKRWDERETINFFYYPAAGAAIPIANVRRVVEQKPPIGQWKIVTEGPDVPPELLSAASPKN